MRACLARHLLLHDLLDDGYEGPWRRGGGPLCLWQPGHKRSLHLHLRHLGLLRLYHRLRAGAAAAVLPHVAIESAEARRSSGKGLYRPKHGNDRLCQIAFGQQPLAVHHRHGRCAFVHRRRLAARLPQRRPHPLHTGNPHLQHHAHHNAELCDHHGRLRQKR